MKKLIIATAILCLAASTAHAGRFGSGGVKSISDAGNGRYRVVCNSGGSKVIAQVGRGWGDDTKSSFGESFYGLSLQQAASKGCR